MEYDYDETDEAMQSQLNNCGLSRWVFARLLHPKLVIIFHLILFFSNKDSKLLRNEMAQNSTSSCLL